MKRKNINVAVATILEARKQLERLQVRAQMPEWHSERARTK